MHISALHSQPHLYSQAHGVEEGAVKVLDRRLCVCRRAEAHEAEAARLAVPAAHPMGGRRLTVEAAAGGARAAAGAGALAQGGSLAAGAHRPLPTWCA